jgi:hypothetical protein
MCYSKIVYTAFSVDGKTGIRPHVRIKKMKIQKWNLTVSGARGRTRCLPLQVPL